MKPEECAAKDHLSCADAGIFGQGFEDQLPLRLPFLPADHPSLLF